MLWPELGIETRCYKIFTFKYVNPNGIYCTTYIEVQKV